MLRASKCLMHELQSLSFRSGLIMSGLIEDKMFRLQVFKMGLTKTALESKQQQRRHASGFHLVPPSMFSSLFEIL